MKIEKHYADGSYYRFNHDLYRQRCDPRVKQEYAIDEFTHKIHKKIRDAYDNSPWLKIKKFKYKDRIYNVENITVVYDSGYVLRLNYVHKNNQGKIIKYYRYIQNINSIKYLKLLKFKNIIIL